jgi:ribonuclease HI
MDEGIPRATSVMPPLVIVHFDGACQPPRGGGVATFGFTVEGLDLEHEEYGLAVAPGAAHATNNVAEYVGAIRALEWLRGRAYKGVVVAYGDSQLVIRQMSGEYEVRAEHLRPYHDLLQRRATAFVEVRFVWVPRTENTEADALSKRALIEAIPAAKPFVKRRMPATDDERPGEV